MTDTKEPAFVAETLAWCNSIRAASGQTPLDRLPKGTQKDALSCPCGEATGLYVWTNSYSGNDYCEGGILPNEVYDFVQAFDAGDLPQYIADREDEPER